jgi:hypothetical protein
MVGGTTPKRSIDGLQHFPAVRPALGVRASDGVAVTVSPHGNADPDLTEAAALDARRIGTSRPHNEM